MPANIKQWYQSFNDQLSPLGTVLSPSWLSGLTVVIISLATVGLTAGLQHYNGSDLQLLQQTQVHHTRSVDDDYVTLDDGFSKSVFISDIPLLVLWGGVGFIAYIFTMSMARSLRRAVDLERELDYVNADRNRIIRESVMRLVLRLILLVAWFLYIEFTLHVMLPYVIALAYAGSGGLGWLVNTEYMTGAAVLLALALHLHVVLFRLVLLKPRVYGSALA